jgi:zinc protease
MRSPAVLLSLVLLTPAVAQRFPVSEHVLANGMKLLVHEDHDIPNAVLYLFFRVGSRNERPGITGISHFFEHMMFNGAKKYGPRQFDIVMEDRGGSNNAYTTRDVTVYTDSFPKSALGLVFEMEADRIQHLSFDPAMIESERGVVISERRASVENDNFGFLHEQLYATAYRLHPYRWPVIGWNADIASWTLEDLREHFRRGYAPNNCVAVVVGDVREAEVLALAKRHFEAIPSQAPPPQVAGHEPVQSEERRVTVRRPAGHPSLLFGYHVAAAGDPDYWALRVLAGALCSGRSSRLHRSLVSRGRLALSVSCWQSLTLDPGLLIFSVDPRPGMDPARVERNVLQDLERVRSGAISEREMRRARNLLLTAHSRELRTNSGRADLLGSYEIFSGGYRKLFEVRDNLERVTAADVQRVARTYLRAENRTVATLVPAEDERDGSKR